MPASRIHDTDSSRLARGQATQHFQKSCQPPILKPGRLSASSPGHCSGHDWQFQPVFGKRQEKSDPKPLVSRYGSYRQRTRVHFRDRTIKVKIGSRWGNEMHQSKGELVFVPHWKWMGYLLTEVVAPYFPNRGYQDSTKNPLSQRQRTRLILDRVIPKI